MFIIILFFSSALSSFTVLHANDAPLPIFPLEKMLAANSNDPIIRTDTPSCVLPFSRAGNLILIKARVDSIDGNFILDTGAPGLVLNITYFRNYPQTVHDAEQTSITGTSSSTVAKTTVSELNFGTYHYYKAEADLLNLGHIENTKNIKILGLLGMGLF